MRMTVHLQVNNENTTCTIYVNSFTESHLKQVHITNRGTFVNVVCINYNVKGESKRNIIVMKIHA